MRNRDQFAFDFDDLGALMRAVHEPARGSVTTGLGRHIDSRLAATPTTMAKAKKILQDGWEIRYGPAGTGSRAIRSKKLITIDGAYAESIELVIKSLSHELGHAMFPNRLPIPKKRAKFARWHEIAKQRRAIGEGEATLSADEAAMEARARGITTAIRASDEHRDICDRHWRGEISRDDARREIAETFHNRRPSSRQYSSYEEKWYKEHLAHWKRLHTEGLVKYPAPE
ncbi:hypothetical protein AB0C34_14425 [Nocardia sp. NPDC049220]|uniref:hypothetical protein n=1 Tax=Nocardia sp. NPDC049220 TaxID=3155273 RepID=UPI0033DB8B31